MWPTLELAFIVPTKDRHEEFFRLWRSLCEQVKPPAEVVVVDAGDRPLPLADLEPGPVVLRYLRTEVASAAGQRNLGLSALGPGVELVGFLDDDMVLDLGAVAAMLRFWRSAEADIGGAAFVLDNHPRADWPHLKRSFVAHSLGLYDRRPGAVARSGFQTMIGRPAKTLRVSWLPTGASVWRREVFREFRFDDGFEGYSYLEDLDFSYRVGKVYGLAVVADARCRHLQAEDGRESGYAFGQREVRNRLYFVKKHPELSPVRCYAALVLRMVMSLTQAARNGRTALLGRAAGNAVGLARSLLGS